MEIRRKNTKAKAGPLPESDTLPDYVSSGPKESLEQTEENIRLWRAVLRLEADCLRVFVLRHVVGFTIEETAEVLGWNRGNVVRADKNARNILRSWLEEGPERE
jgi:RNA polymerase sigma factor (sigma-70 family)